MSLTNVLFKRFLFTANLLTVAIITQPECTEPCLNAKCWGTVERGDNYDAKIINVMLEVTFKRYPKQCFSQATGLEIKVTSSKKKKKNLNKIWLKLENCRAVMHTATTQSDVLLLLSCSHLMTFTTDDINKGSYFIKIFSLRVKTDTHAPNHPHTHENIRKILKKSLILVLFLQRFF